MIFKSDMINCGVMVGEKTCSVMVTGSNLSCTFFLGGVALFLTESI